MGNSQNGCAQAVHSETFFARDGWIEGRALDQLKHLEGLDGVRAVAGFPDLHPGKYGPVGCAVLADRLHPQLVGSDIGCGMGLFRLDLPLRKLKLDKAAERLRNLAGPVDGDEMAERLEELGLDAALAPEALGSVGGGNHFCEAQKVVQAAPESGLEKGALVLLVHSGSRGVGHSILSRLIAEGLVSLDPESEAGRDYLRRHNEAVAWAGLNRKVIAERAAMALRATCEPLVDVLHNLLSPEFGGWLHRKGAAVASGLVPLAGSRAAPSFLMQPLGHAGALASMAHGAGRKYDRSSMHGRVRAGRADLAALKRTRLGGRVICDEKTLLIEEAPEAYKPVLEVVSALEQTDVARPVAEMHPLITYKRAIERGAS
ncbi:RNA ligase RtcB family protein [Alisedimentitalea sp. MJ-SS2]|uniref:RNA ligase RtcB family protein n=1 Tax=Aliisedimentitalea sp. MJ-SS2 TaxID=3049795 RepID=UPI00291031CB|nr:RNA ligase RtcB family protein [Alisedimentitalea sp. MJ-SS2]MDU8926753.1 RNA ligase RtcB family protein [Alisedimentitalea sp. MJ-SS2]